MSDKPAYLGLLNAIAVGETRGGELLKAWSGASSDPAVRAVLDIVAIRETEHGAAFAKRMCELGFAVLEKPRERFDADLEFVRSSASDRTKFERILRYQEAQPAADPLTNLLAEPTIDPETGALLGRFIAEERDSERRLRACYSALCRADSPTGVTTTGNGDAESLLADLAARLDRLSETLAELKSMRTTA